MEVPITRFATTPDGVRIAYQDFGEGPPVVLCSEWVSHQEMQWDGRGNQQVLEHFAKYVRLVTFDIRGIGLSDRFQRQPTVAERLHDISAVMDATGIDSAGLYGLGTGGKLALNFAAEFPERVSRLVLDNMPGGPAQRKRAGELGGYDPDDHLAEAREELAADMDDWGVDARPYIAWAIPSMVGDEEFAEWLARFWRVAATRDTAIRQIQGFYDLKIDQALKTVTTPTLITHTKGNRVMPVGMSRAVAEALQHATLREFGGDDDIWWFAPYWRDILDVQLAFLSGREIERPYERQFAVVLFTDIVASTKRSAEVGDQAWAAKLERHDLIAQEVVESAKGSIVKNTGDGLLMTFGSPTAAIEAALALRKRLRDIGLEIRSGLHGGDIEVRDGDISGAVVNLAARVEQAAEDGAIYMTTAVREMTLGSSQSSEVVGEHKLKGFEDEFVLHRLAD